MDANQFDALARSLDLLAPRRVVLGLLGGGMSALLTQAGAEDVDAKKNGKKRKKKKCKGATRKCGKKCIPAGNCCNAAECGSIYTCEAGACVCPDPNDIPCSANTCCDPAQNEVCAFFAETCEAGCPETDFCTDDEFFICSNDCVCVTSVEDVTSCTEGLIPECIECTSDAQCTTAFGEPAVCISNGEFCDFCPGLTAFCVTNSCPTDGAPRRGAQGHSLLEKRKLAR